MADEENVTQDRLKVGLVHHAEWDGLAAASTHALHGCHRAECLLGRQLPVLPEKEFDKVSTSVPGPEPDP